MSGDNLLKARVLVIEDEATQRRLARGHLESLDCDVITAVNGKEGLDILEKNSDIRIVITDLAMPEMDGFQVTEAIRRTEKRYTYIMILTTQDDKQSLTQGLSLGADDFVSKPIVKQELALRLKSAIRLLRLEDHDRLVSTLAELAAVRSGEQDSHLKRIKEYCYLIASDLRKNHPELEISKQAVEDIADISVLHDIGKICIPDGLLHKRGKYSPKEYEIIKDHTVTGAKILKDLAIEAASPFLNLGYEIAMFHHEKWDGSGYPTGIQEGEIPLAARIVAFADAYDAILSRRSYKDPLSPSHAEKIISAEKGKHFDPLIVEAYLRNTEAFSEIHKKYPEPKLGW